MLFSSWCGSCRAGIIGTLCCLRLVTLFPLLTGLILLAFASRPETRSGMRNVHAPRHSHDFCCSSFQLL